MPKHHASFFRGLRVLWISLTIIICDASSNHNNSRNSSPIFPISQLESSLAASAGQASVIAVRCDDCIVVLSMSPQQNLLHNNKVSLSQTGTGTGTGTGETNTNKVGDAAAIEVVCDDSTSMHIGTHTDESSLIPIISSGPIQTQIPSTPHSSITGTSTGAGRRTTRSRIMHILQKSSGLGLFMTGFSADTQHLSRYAAAQVSEHEHLNEGSNFYAQGLMCDVLAPRFRDATLSGGSRPFGVQALVVSSHPREGRPMQLMTLDPSGNYRYWHGIGACIGKDIDLCKKHLNRIVEDESFNSPQTWSDGLDLCMRSLLETVKESQNMKETPREEILQELDAMVIFDTHTSRRPFTSAVIRQGIIHQSFLKSFSAT